MNPTRYKTHCWLDSETETAYSDMFSVGEIHRDSVDNYKFVPLEQFQHTHNAKNKYKRMLKKLQKRHANVVTHLTEMLIQERALGRREGYTLAYDEIHRPKPKCEIGYEQGQENLRAVGD